MEITTTTLPFPQVARRLGRSGMVNPFGELRGCREHRRSGANAQLQDALFNDLDPRTVLKSEQPIHRQMIAMATQGYTNREIAASVGYKTGAVGNVLRQPFARQAMIEQAKKDVSLEIRDFLETEVLTNLRVIRDIRDDPNVKPETRLAAADRLTDRHLGKPTQPFTLPAGGKDPSKMTDAELDAALRATGFDPSAANAAATAAPSGQAEASCPV